MPYRELAITVQQDGRIAVGVYTATGERISGTFFQHWPSVLNLINRVQREGYHCDVFIRTNF